MSRILVTGGCGFIGGRLARALVSAGEQVEILDDLSSGSMKNCPANVTVRVHDITRPLPDLPRFDTVYHLAAVSRIGMCARDPQRAVRVNESGTLRLLVRSAVWGADFVFASSCTAADPKKSVYGQTKRNGERLCASHTSLKGAGRIAVARLFNVYGPGEPEIGPTSTLIARFARAKRKGDPLSVYGDGLQRRDFVHVDDAIGALILLSEKATGTAPYDVGTGVNYSVMDAVGMFSQQFVRLERPEGEMQDTLADPADLCALGWEPKYKLPDYIRGLK